MTRSRQSATAASQFPQSPPDREQGPGERAGQAPVAADIGRAEGSGRPLAGEARPQPRLSPSRRALLTAGGVTAGGVALSMAGGIAGPPSAEAAADPVLQGAQVVSVNDAPYNVTGNGWTDDTNAIQAALDATPPGGKCLIPAPPSFAFTSTQASPCVFTATGTLYTTGMTVVLWGSSTSLPGGFTAGTQYYVVSPSGDQFELSATLNGSPIGNLNGPPGSGWVSAYYLVSNTLQIPNGVSVEGPAAAPPGKYRDAAVPTPPQIRVAAGANLNAIISDTAWVGSGTAPSSAILINGLVIDGNAAQQTGGAGHGIVLMTAASSVVNCAVQNVPGNGIMFADQSHAGNNSTGSQVECGAYFCRIYKAGGSGIVVQNNANRLTDGYLMYNIVDNDFTGSLAGWAIQALNCGDWQVVGNHVYALLNGAYQLHSASHARIMSNCCDNHGQQSASQSVSVSWSGSTFTPSSGLTIANGQLVQFSGTLPTGISAGVFYYMINVTATTFQVAAVNGATTGLGSGSGTGTVTGYYVCYDIAASPFGRCTIANNRVDTNETIVASAPNGGNGVGNFLYYLVAAQANGQNNEVTFIDNSVRQTDATPTGASTGYAFLSGTGTLVVKGTTEPQTVLAASSGNATSPTPVINGTVSFPSAVPVLQATTGLTGYTLNTAATTTILTWTAPNDGQMHRVLLVGELVVTTAQTGGAIELLYTDPGGGSRGATFWAGSLGTGSQKAQAGGQLTVSPNSTVTLEQSSGQSAGASVLYAELWGI